MSSSTFVRSVLFCTVGAAIAADASSLPLQGSGPFQSRGMLSGWAAGVFTKDGSSMSNFRQKLPADQTTPMPAPAEQLGTGNSEPRYSTFFNKVRTLKDPTGLLEIDAIASGNGVFPQTTDGVPTLNGFWAAVSVSVTEASPCQQPGSGTPNWFKQAKDYYNGLSGGNAGAEVVTYYFAGSQGLDEGLAGNTRPEMSRVHFGMPATAQTDISSLDYGIGIELGNVAMPATVLLPSHKRVFFSVTEASAAVWRNQYPAGWFAQRAEDPNAPTTLTNHPPRGADIYMVEWNATAGDWDGPFLYAPAELLGINGADPSSDVDGLDVFDRLGRVIFSPKIGTAFLPEVTDFQEQSQLMIVDLDGGPAERFAYFQIGPGDTTAKALKTTPPGGGAPVRVTSRLQVTDILPGGNAQDEIDVVCVIDPDGAGADEYLGIARQRWANEQNPLQLSMSRWGSNAGGGVLHGTVTGWGGLTPSNARITIYCKVGAIGATGALVPSSAWRQIGVTSRLAAQGSTNFTVVVPAPLRASSNAFFVTLQTPAGLVTSWPIDLADFPVDGG